MGVELGAQHLHFRPLLADGQHVFLLDQGVQILIEAIQMGGDGGKFVLPPADVHGSEVAGLGLHQAVENALDEVGIVGELAHVKQGDEDEYQNQTHSEKHQLLEPLCRVGFGGDDGNHRAGEALRGLDCVQQVGKAAEGGWNAALPGAGRQKFLPGNGVIIRISQGGTGVVHQEKSRSFRLGAEGLGYGGGDVHDKGDLPHIGRSLMNVFGVEVSRLA